jgi:hypothetical protein
MSHYSRLSKIVVDVPAAEHDREVAFWSAAVGQELTQGFRYPEYHGAALHGGEFGLLIQRLTEPAAHWSAWAISSGVNGPYSASYWLTAARPARMVNSFTAVSATQEL